MRRRGDTRTGYWPGATTYAELYAGTVSNALTPGFGPPRGWGPLKVPFLATGRAFLWGSVVVDAPAEAPLLLQFRAWPAGFPSYEAAVASGDPSPPVGVSEIVPAIPPNVIYEFFIPAGPVWLSPLVAPGAAPGPLACTLAANSLILSWPTTNSGGWLLVAAGALTSNAVWSPVERPVVPTNGYNRVTVPLTNEVQFFRLSR